MTIRRVLLVLVLIIVLIPVGVILLLHGGHHEGPGEVSRSRLPAAVVAARAERETAAIARVAPGSGPTKQILFGDLHVHTTFSADAFTRTLPMLQGEGAHPPADACDFARFCSNLDFWSINDHAEAITPQHWAETKETIRQCNAAAGDPHNPDVVAFLGWEWTQVGRTAADHYGHKNVIFRDTAEDRVPRRPIAAASALTLAALRQGQPLWQRIRFPLLDFSNRQRYLDFGEFQREVRSTPICPDGVDTHQLPADCLESAATPRELYEKLAQWGFDSIVIPHGTTWGFYTPPGTTFDKQLTKAEHDPERQTLFEIYSGHGNSEEYRDWKAVDWDAKGNPICPEPTKDYEPCCWRAGEIIRARCGNAPADECERRVRAARANYVAAGITGHLTVPGATVEEWKDCGQCRDCFIPAFNFRPGNSGQYALAITNFDDPTHPLRFRFGFIGSSDNHSARPGTGYKEYARRQMTETTGARDAVWRRRILGPQPAAGPESVPFDPTTSKLQGFQLVETERQASFFLTGGLVAVHSEGRDRDSIWNALKHREVYGTSGERILLWFDLLNGPSGALPMGSETQLAETPRFRVRAVGSFKQLPGCPASSLNALPPERLQYLCRGECYNPSDERHLITRIEIVRIRPQQRPGEPVRQLIEDPWRRFDCPNDPAGCAVEFDDPDFVSGARDVVYYARAVQEPTPAINAGQLRCKYDASGNCVEVHPCFGDYRTPFNDDCLSPAEERAWSSPIYVNRAA
ncbi:MAG TPA: DUF3604 domain-containing protein [Candidatus Kryptonia bacterium]|nr:DUF3604 domain-containing protein [Candidatus Kryptonia bacterium]